MDNKHESIITTLSNWINNNTRVIVCLEANGITLRNSIVINSIVDFGSSCLIAGEDEFQIELDYADLSATEFGLEYTGENASITIDSI